MALTHCQTGRNPACSQLCFNTLCNRIGRDLRPNSQCWWLAVHTYYTQACSPVRHANPFQYNRLSCPVAHGCARGRLREWPIPCLFLVTFSPASDIWAQTLFRTDKHKHEGYEPSNYSALTACLSCTKFSVLNSVNLHTTLYLVSGTNFADNHPFGLG